MRAVSGDGQFITKTGALIAAPELPREALPSVEPENSRHFESVTVREADMDADLRDALFDPSYDNGELQDDFVELASEVSEHGEEPAETFDYDSHIKKMMASAQQQGGGKFSSISEDGGSEDDEEDDDCTSSRPEEPSTRKGKIDREFDNVLLEYDSDECGSLEDPEEDPTLQVKTNRNISLHHSAFSTFCFF